MRAQNKNAPQHKPSNKRSYGVENSLPFHKLKGLPQTFTHLFSRVCRPVQNRPQNPALASCPFSTRKSRFEVPESGDLGERLPGKGGVDKAKKKEKRMRKKVGFMAYKPRVLWHANPNLHPI